MVIALAILVPDTDNVAIGLIVRALADQRIYRTSIKV